MPDLYDRVRPSYLDELFEDLVAITGAGDRSSVLEVGCGTGQATGSVAALGWSVTAEGMAALARKALALYSNVNVETSTFEEWDDRGRRFDLIVAAASWHWLDPEVGWRRAHDLLRPGGWMALLGNIVVRRPAEPQVYAETADLHERFSRGNPDLGDPPFRGRGAGERLGPRRRPRSPVRPDDGALVPRWCSGSTAMGSPTSSATSPPVAPWTLMSVIRYWTRSHSESGPRCAIAHHAAT